MEEGKWRGNGRRAVLQAAGAIGAFSVLPTTSAIRNGETRSDKYDLLRGSIEKPIDEDAIGELREDFAKQSATRSNSETKVYLDLTTFENDRILGYNILMSESGDNSTIQEQYIVSGGHTGGSEVTSDESTETTDRLRAKADQYLDDAKSISNSIQSSDEPTPQDWDIDWGDWDSTANDYVHWEAPKEASTGFGGDIRPGAVIFHNRIRRSWDDERIAARTKVRLESGREHCLDGHDDYCASNTVHTGWRNREADIHHDWDQPGNGFSGPTMLVGLDPVQTIEDVTKSRSASIGLDLDQNPNLSLGYSTGIEMDKSGITDRTTSLDAKTHHEWEVMSSSGPSAKYSSEFEIGSVAKYNDNCGGSTRILEVDADLRWGLRLGGR
ncbi:hypothetical protein [Halovivax gelatinilyticus]|uniref:hypothetical protein n=1 Tax=Halovivax gelatinilyticus TaxID=2961597 RepID=UPI0020CA8894|nr:hypothetical protein [Halovivax gelatinilyticus]